MHNPNLNFHDNLQWLPGDSIYFLYIIGHLRLLELTGVYFGTGCVETAQGSSHGLSFLGGPCKTQSIESTPKDCIIKRLPN